jgi:Ca2+-binding EF-hand superfamily protein
MSSDEGTVAMRELFTKMFNQWDADASGTIDISEFDDIEAKLGEQTSGYISVFIKMAKDNDKNGDGKISKDEWFALFDQMMESNGAPSMDEVNFGYEIFGIAR